MSKIILISDVKTFQFLSLDSNENTEVQLLYMYGVVVLHCRR